METETRPARVEPIERPMTREQFAALDTDDLWQLFIEMRATIAFFEGEDRRKAEFVDAQRPVVSATERMFYGEGTVPELKQAFDRYRNYLETGTL